MFPEIESGKFLVKIASTVNELTAAQKFRYEIFHTDSGLTNEDGIDADYYDSFCDHLLVIDKENDALVGTYRLHPGYRLESSQGFYCENEFEIAHLPMQRERILELGRSCVHPNYRDGSIIQLLWLAITAYLDAGKFELLMGAASVPQSQGAMINEMAAYLSYQAPAPANYLVDVKEPYCMTFGYPHLADYRRLGHAGDISMHDFLPPLLKGYLNLGAWIASAPAWDKDFQTYDFLVLLHKDQIHPGYLKRFRRILAHIGSEQKV